jgi:hypothetical protein
MLLAFGRQRHPRSRSFRPARPLGAIALVVCSLSWTARAESPPAALACLARWYAITPAQVSGRWVAALPDGSLVPYDDGFVKTDADLFDIPDVKDLFVDRYVPGPIGPVTTVDFDPGRIRIESIFQATYGTSEKTVDLVSIDFLGTRVRVHRRVAPRFLSVARRLGEALTRDASLRPFLVNLGGTFAWRNIAGTTRLSAHAYGISIDLNPKLTTYWRWSRTPRWENKVPQTIVDAFEAEGFIWGGRWYHYDTMHFEYRPELVDQSCYPPRR